MIIIFFAAAEGVWSGLVSYCFFRFSGSWFQSRHTLSGQRSLLLQQQLHSVWQRVLEMLDWQGSEAWLHQNWGRFMLHDLYPQWILVQSKNEICRTLLPASAVSPRAWLLCFNVIILSSCNASGLVPLNDFTLLLSGDKSNRESRWREQKRTQCGCEYFTFPCFFVEEEGPAFLSEKAKNHQFLLTHFTTFLLVQVWKHFGGVNLGLVAPAELAMLKAAAFEAICLKQCASGRFDLHPTKR